jgi:hypothetical protein
VIDDFERAKKLPETVDANFASAVTALLKGFEPVSVSAEDPADKLAALGPCEIEAFKAKINAVIDGYTSGKDKSKVRIIVKR